MYEYIGIGFYCSIIFVILAVLIHDIGINAGGYVFDNDSYDTSKKRWGYQINFFGTDECDTWFGIIIFGVLLGVIAAAFWPISIVALTIFFALRTARSIVRTGKKNMEDHIKDLHDK